MDSLIKSKVDKIDMNILTNKIIMILTVYIQFRDSHMIEKTLLVLLVLHLQSLCRIN